MNQSNKRGHHTFHVPVMGTGFTIDTPLRIAKYGISSVISLVDDLLIERMRKFHCERLGEPYEEIAAKAEDSRARRITVFLDFMHRIVKRQTKELQAEPFAAGSDITRYFELLPAGPLRARYEAMLAETDPIERKRLEDELRPEAVPGSIDVNIMSKSDCDVYERGEKLPQEFSTASSALRGFANSTLDSSIIYSAGMNPRLYSYTGQFPDFFPDENGHLKKHIVLKVSDYRSAIVQGKYFAKRGLWVSEYRIESGLNCGGHAFPSTGYALGPILDEFKETRHELLETLLPMYEKALTSKGRELICPPPEIRITVQGGIGTAEEDLLMREYYGMDATGWATPFMLVPEVANVDDAHLAKLCAATDSDVDLSDASPYGAPFWTLKESASQLARAERVESGKPGAVCNGGFVRFNSDYTKVPVCAASKTFIRHKLQDIEEGDYTPEQREYLREITLAKSCICVDLAGAATLKHNIDPGIRPAVCCGPNIVNFSKIATLEEMAGHIYGRLSLLTNPERPHMFLKELGLYIDFLRKELTEFSLKLSPRPAKYFEEFKGNVAKGIDYYRARASELAGTQQERFLHDLHVIAEKLSQLPTVEAEAAPACSR